MKKYITKNSRQVRNEKEIQLVKSNIITSHSSVPEKQISLRPLLQKIVIFTFLFRPGFLSFEELNMNVMPTFLEEAAITELPNSISLNDSITDIPDFFTSLDIISFANLHNHANSESYESLNLSEFETEHLDSINASDSEIEEFTEYLSQVTTTPTINLESLQHADYALQSRGPSTQINIEDSELPTSVESKEVNLET